MTRILLIRHAATDLMSLQLCGHTPGISLSETGQQQADHLARALVHRPIEAIYCSPLERAQQTAQAIAATRGLSPIIYPSFIELDFGEWTGKSFDELRANPQWNEYNRTRSSVTPPNGEPPVEVLRRARNGLDEVVNQHPGGECAIVTHGDVIRSLLTSLLGMRLDDLLRFEIAPASVTEVWLGGDYPLIQSLNRLYTDER
jgi:probable phosphoglycerate mutase